MSFVLLYSQSFCEAAWQRVLQRRLFSYEEILNIQEDISLGCEEARRIQASGQIYDRYMSFRSICHDIMAHGKSKSGLNVCKRNQDCFTKCVNGNCEKPGPGEYGL
jgi:hypothetical protein